jgi:hypothetical protein
MANQNGFAVVVFELRNVLGHRIVELKQTFGMQRHKRCHRHRFGNRAEQEGALFHTVAECPFVLLIAVTNIHRRTFNLAALDRILEDLHSALKAIEYRHSRQPWVRVP